MVQSITQEVYEVSCPLLENLRHWPSPAKQSDQARDKMGTGVMVKHISLV